MGKHEEWAKCADGGHPRTYGCLAGWLAGLRIEPSSRTIHVTVSGAARGERKKTGKLKLRKFEKFLGEKNI